ncbi:MAG: CPBP family intramembrane glutamic endopeptidase [Bacteroidota bacterium]
MDRTIRIVLITVIAFATHYIFDDLYFSEVRNYVNTWVDQLGISHNLTYLLFGIPLFIGVLIMHRARYFLDALGLKNSFKKGFLFPLICTLPMLIGYAVVFDFNSEITLNEILISAIAAAFFEELYFRGFLFGQLYRFTQLGFIPSVITGALLFGAVHLYQSQELLTAAGIFLTTFLGAVLFAWVYAEWNNNIWIPIFLHLFMNLFWLLFSAGENALGGVYANIFRILTIVLVILITVVYKRRNGIRLEVNKRTLWMKKDTVPYHTQ